MGKRKNTSQRNSNSKKGKQGEHAAARMPEGETPQDALVNDVVSLRFTRSTGSVSHSSKPENSLSEK